jgi:glycogen debranching enzyme
LQLIREHLVTPFGLRSLSFRDSRYVGNGNDVNFLPKCWSGSVDATWLGCYCDARNRAGVPLDGTQLFEPFKAELQRRGYGHISGAFAGDPPHEPCDYVASASALGEIMRIYARDILKLNYVV